MRTTWRPMKQQRARHRTLIRDMTSQLWANLSCFWLHTMSSVREGSETSQRLIYMPPCPHTELIAEEETLRCKLQDAISYASYPGWYLMPLWRRVSATWHGAVRDPRSWSASFGGEKSQRSISAHNRYVLVILTI